jgi:hypothetical protein
MLKEMMFHLALGTYVILASQGIVTCPSGQTTGILIVPMQST